MNLSTLPDGAFLGVSVQHTPRCASTMDLVAALADRGAPEGTCIVTDEQTAGRGRAGRTWTAPPGTCILLSALLEPNVSPDRLGQLSILLAVAVARLVERQSGRTATIKWPNDVLVDGAKVSGVLATVRLADGRPRVIIGIGLNVNIPLNDLPPGATSLYALTNESLNRESVLRDLLAELEVVYQSFVVGETAVLWDDANARLAYRGEAVRITEGDNTFTGTLLGLAPTGALRLRLPDGTDREFWSGDLVRGPRPVSGSRSPALRPW